MSPRIPQSSVPSPVLNAAEPETLLVKTLLAIRNNRLDVALAEVEKVLEAYPNFRLAHLIRGVCCSHVPSR